MDTLSPVDIRRIFENALEALAVQGSGGQHVLLPAGMIAGIAQGGLQPVNIKDGIVHLKNVVPGGDSELLPEMGKTGLNLLYTLPWGPFVIRGKTMKRDVCRFSADEISAHPYLVDAVVRAMNSHASVKGRKILGVFCNYYNDGSNYTPYHQDSYGCNVLTISFGGSRDFLTKPVAGGSSTKYVCEDGDVIIFTEDWNSKHKHSIPSRSKGDPRISVVVFFE